MPSIVRVRVPGRLPEMRLLVLDDGRRLYVDAEQAARHGLAPGESLDSDLLADLEERDAYLRGRQKALRLLAVRPRTAAELRGRLRQYGIPETQARAVLRDLAAAGYLDDLAFARVWVAARTASRPRGVVRLRWELREKGVAASLIEQAIREAAGGDDLPAAEEQRARALVERRARTYARLAPEARLRRVAGLLRRRGFTSGTIARLLRSVGRSGPDLSGE